MNIFVRDRHGSQVPNLQVPTDNRNAQEPTSLICIFLGLKDSSHCQQHGKNSIRFLSLIFLQLQPIPCAIFLEVYLLRSWHLAMPSGKPVLTGSFLYHYISKHRIHCSSVGSWTLSRIIVSVGASTYTFYSDCVDHNLSLLFDPTLSLYQYRGLQHDTFVVLFIHAIN